MSVLLALLPLLVACSREPRLEGQVVDIWGNPIEGATVVMEGVSERPLTDKNGKFDLPLTAGPHKLKAGREGYIQAHADVDVPEDLQNVPHPMFELYPKPEEAGFYIVGVSEYERLQPQPVVQIGSEIDSVRGIKQIGDVGTEGTKLRVLFHTPLKMDQVMRLGLTLHKLDYVKEKEMTGPIAPTVVPINLYTVASTVDTDLQPLRSRNDYLIVSKNDLEPGAYAFDTQGLLSTSDPQAFLQIPEPLRVAYPLEIR